MGPSPCFSVPPPDLLGREDEAERESSGAEPRMRWEVE